MQPAPARRPVAARAHPWAGRRADPAPQLPGGQVKAGYLRRRTPVTPVSGARAGRRRRGQESAAGGSGAARAATSSPIAGQSRADAGAGPRSTPAAADTAADQPSIDAQAAAMTVAEQNLAGAVLTRPIAGTVAAIGLAVNGEQHHDDRHRGRHRSEHGVDPAGPVHHRRGHDR